MSKGIILPRGYLSHSQMELWSTSRAGYASRYFKRCPDIDTAELRFGKYISHMLENDPTNPLVAKVPRYEIPEMKFLENIRGIPFKGQPDTFQPDTLAFREYKTGRQCKTPCMEKHNTCVKPWDNLRVRKHKQLPRYAMLIRSKYGDYEKKCHLDWIGTELVKTEHDERGFEWDIHGKKLKLTGEIYSFERIIEEWEVDKTEEEVVKIAQEISVAYKEFLISEI